MNKEEVLSLLEKQTAFFDPQFNMERFTTEYLAEKLQLKRNTISKYLNAYCSEGQLVKINTRPVVFLHKKEFELQFFPVAKNQFDSLEELFANQPLHALDFFSIVIGHKGSLAKAVNELKTSVFYPNGLPVLLTGDSGTGKSFLAELTYQYALQEGFIQEEAPFIVFNCAQYINNPELLTSNLFGYVKGAFTGADQTVGGAFEKADGGYLFLDEVHRLSAEGQEKLFTYLDKGVIYRVGDTKSQHRPKVRLIFATTENTVDTFLKTFIRRIPLQIKLPSLMERPLQEKEEFLVGLLIQESQKIGRPISLNSTLKNLLLEHTYTGNVGELKSVIKYIVANTYMKQKNEVTLLPSIFELPENLLSENQQISTANTEDWLQVTPDSLLSEMISYRFRESELLLQTYLKIQRYILEDKIDLLPRNNKAVQATQHYFDHLIFQGKSTKNNALFQFIYGKMKAIFELVKDEERTLFGGNSVLALSYYFYHRKTNFLHQGAEQDKKLMTQLQESYPDYWQCAKMILKLVEQQLAIPGNDLDLVVVTLFLFSVEVTFLENYPCGVVIAHGYATASSIANVVNRLLNQNVFEAFDMEIDVSPKEIGQRVLSYCQNKVNDRGVLVLVDMGSLTSIYQELEKTLEVPIGLINNVSTQLALMVGEKMLNNQSIKEIIDTTEAEFQLETKIIYPEKRIPVILTTCQTGIGTAERIKVMLEKSLAGVLKLEIRAVDFELLTKEEVYLDETHQIMAVVGTEDPKLSGIPFFSLENLIMQNDISPLLKLINHQLTPEAQERIKEKIVQYFSLERVLDSLIILDSRKVLAVVSDFMESYEMLTQKRLTSSKKVSLYVHLSCLIERLIRNEPIQKYTGIKPANEEGQKDFQLLKKALSGIEQAYSVRIPDSELYYVYDILCGKTEYINVNEDF